MPYSKHIIIRKGYAYLKITGNYAGKEELAERIVELKDLAEANRVSTIIVDFSAIKEPISGTDKFDLGELAAKVWGHKLKVALIYRKGEISGMFENVAVNRGANVRVVSSLEEAESWIIKSHQEISNPYAGR